MFWKHYAECDGETNLFKGLIAGVAGGLLASFLMEQFQAAWSATAKALESGDEKNMSGAGKKSEPATVRAARSQKSIGRPRAKPCIMEWARDRPRFTASSRK